MGAVIRIAMCSSDICSRGLLELIVTGDPPSFHPLGQIVRPKEKSPWDALDELD
jgi:hypothetical protein